MVNGIVSYGTYVPRARLRRDAIARLLGGPAMPGCRAVAGYDEDSTSMAVEAGRNALHMASGATPASLYFATTAPPYLDKTNATTVHAALGLPRDVGAYDVGASVRSAVGALLAAADASQPTLVVAGDVRTGLPGSADELHGGDGASALLFGGDDAIATIVSHAHTTEEFLDRWRVPGNSWSVQWEERFGEAVYQPLAEAATADALKLAGLTADDVDHLIVTGTHGRAVRRARQGLGCSTNALVDDLALTVGNTGTAHPAMLLAQTLDRANPGEVIVVVVLSDGADAVVIRTTDQLPTARNRQRRRLADQVNTGTDTLPYATFLTWRGELRREPPRRPDPNPPTAPPARRSQQWKFAFVASRCQACGMRHLPPSRVCLRCGSTDEMTPEPMSDALGTVTTFTVDRLAYSMNPPVVVAIVDFDGGGRFQCEMTDVDPSAVAIGSRVEMTFRRLHTADGVHNYFWKARPLQGDQ